MTQEDLAERAGISWRAISDLERGDRRSPRRDTVHRLATALGLTERERERFEGSRRSAAVVTNAAETAARSLQPPPLVGRSADLAVLERHLGGDGPAVLLFSGEPGVGKTRLLKEGIRLAAGHEYAVLRGECRRVSVDEPYAPLPTALTRYMSQQAPARLHADLNGCASLGWLLPELAELAQLPLPLGALAEDQERRMIFAAITRYLSNIGGPAGTLLVLDDLQWVNGEACHALAAVLDGATDLRVIGAYRDSEVCDTHPLATLLGDLAERQLVLHRALAPLESDECGRLLDALLEEQEPGSVDAATRERMVARSGGLPFFLVSCVRALMSEPDTPSAGLVPWTVAQSVRGRLTALPEMAQATIHVAALSERPIPREVLLRTAGVGTGATEGLDVACRSRLLTVDEFGRYRVAHDLVRDVIEADLGAAQRVMLHRLIAEALEEGGADAAGPSELAWHYLQGDLPERAFPYAMEAGRQAEAVFAYEEAERQFRAALGVAPRLGPGSDTRRAEAEALEGIGRMQLRLDRLDGALRTLETASVAYRQVDEPDGESRVVAQIALLLCSLGHVDDALARLEPLVARLAGAGSLRARATLHSCRSRVLYIGGRHKDSAAAAGEASALARRLGDDRLLLASEVSRGTALYIAGKVDEGITVLESMILLAMELDVLEDVVRGHQNVGDAYQKKGDLVAAGEHYEQALEIVERAGLRMHIASLVTCLGECRFLEGKWPAARELYERAAQLSSDLEPGRLTSTLPEFRAELDLAEGNWEAARANLEEALHCGHLPPSWEPRCCALLAEVDLAEGHPDIAIRRLSTWSELRDLAPYDIAWLMTTLGRAWLETGDAHRAAALLDRDLERLQPLPLQRADALTVRGMIHAASNQCSQADGCFEEAVSLAGRARYPYGEARALYEWGVVNVKNHAMGPARQHLEAALAIFRRLGARPYVERAEQLLRTAT